MRVRLNRSLSALALIVIAASAILLGAACEDGGDGGGGATPTAPATTGEPTAGGPTSTPGELTEMAASLTNDPFALTLSQDTAPAGNLNIQVTNDGSVGHNFWVVKSDLPPGQLPLNSNVVDVDSLDVITRSGLVTNDEDLDPGDRLQVLVGLEPGSYVLFCNVPDHYTSGMNAALTVE